MLIAICIIQTKHHTHTYTHLQKPHTQAEIHTKTKHFLCIKSLSYIAIKQLTIGSSHAILITIIYLTIAVCVCVCACIRPWVPACLYALVWSYEVLLPRERNKTCIYIRVVLTYAHTRLWIYMTPEIHTSDDEGVGEGGCEDTRGIAGLTCCWRSRGGETPSHNLQHLVIHTSFINMHENSVVMFVVDN